MAPVLGKLDFSVLELGKKDDLVVALGIVPVQEKKDFSVLEWGRKDFFVLGKLDFFVLGKQDFSVLVVLGRKDSFLVVLGKKDFFDLERKGTLGKNDCPVSWGKQDFLHVVWGKICFLVVAWKIFPVGKKEQLD